MPSTVPQVVQPGVGAGYGYQGQQPRNDGPYAFPGQAAARGESVGDDAARAQAERERAEQEELELAMAISMSMEEEKARQQTSAGAQPPPARTTPYEQPPP